MIPRRLLRRTASVVGEPLDDVRLRHGREAEALAARHGAVAVTRGNTVSLGRDMPPLDSIAGEAILAHELAHAAQQRGATSPAAAVDEAHDETAADAAAVRVVAGGTGGRPSAAPQPRSGLAIRRCSSDTRDLTSDERKAVDVALEESTSGLPIVEQAVKGAWDDGYEDLLRNDKTEGFAQTTGSTTKVPGTSLGMFPAILGAVLMHEASHLHDPYAHGIGDQGPGEGFGYAFEFTSLRRSLFRMAEGDDARPGVIEQLERIHDYGKDKGKPPRLLEVEYPVFRLTYRAMSIALTLLYMAADGTAIPWGDKGKPPGWDPMDSTRAQQTIVRLMEMKTDARGARGFEQDLLRWCLTHYERMSETLGFFPDPTKKPAPPRRER